MKSSEPRTVVITVNPAARGSWKGHVEAPVDIIEADTPPDRWQMEPGVVPGDARWQAADAAITKALETLRAVPIDSYERVAVFPLAPFGIAALLAQRLWQYIKPRRKALSVYHWHRAEDRWENWGPSGLPAASAVDSTSYAVTLPEHPRYDVTDVAIVIAVSRRADRHAVDVAMRAHTNGRVETLVLEPADGPDRDAITGPAHANALARTLASRLDAIKDAFPGARRHVFYLGPLPLLVRLATDFHVPNDLWVYDWQHGSHYRPTAAFPRGNLWTSAMLQPEIMLVAEPSAEVAVMPLKAAIERRGCRVFFAPVSLSPGDLWDVAKRRALRGARVVAVAVDASTDDDWDLHEDVARAVDRAKAGALRLVPIRLHRDAPLPYGLSRVWPIDWRDADPALVDDIAIDIISVLRLEHAGFGARGPVESGAT